MNSFIDRLKYVRGGLTQEEFAIRLSLKKQNIQQYESGTEPKMNFFEKLVNIFEVNINWLLTGKGDKYIQQSGGDEKLKAEIERLKIENEKIKKMVGFEVTKLIQGISLNDKGNIEYSQKKTIFTLKK